MLLKHNFFCLRTEMAHPNTAELHLHNITVKVQDLFVKLRYEESYKRYTMKQPHLCFAIAGLCLGVVSCGHGQTLASDSTAFNTSCGNCPRCKTADTSPTDSALMKVPIRPKFLEGIRLTGGQLTIPFKIRTKEEHGTFRLTTDVTLGAFVGLTKRLSENREQFLTIPMTAGLTFVNINDNNTSMEFAAADNGETEVVPGLTWSSGIILQLEQYNVGLIFGKDYASEVGDQWIYHRKLWWSFGIGFSFAN